jgi:glycosyltransferase involved in cell wall biosynthesis
MAQEIENLLPSFSMIYETENLSSVELDNIYKSLASIANQDISPEQANEFLIIEGDYAPEEVIAQLCSKYPWIQVKRMPRITYHEAKMKGATFATGEIVVICDSDCIYEPNWLRNMLTPFAENSDVNVVAGETTTPIRNPYELAVAMNYLFRRFSHREHLYPSNHYHLNSVAFRRGFLLANPIPIDLPLYRGHCKVHTHNLCELKGYTIWKHPQAKAIHEPPVISFISWRYLLYGRDDVLSEQAKLFLTQNQQDVDKILTKSNLSFIQQVYTFIRRFLQPFKPKQVLEVLQEDPRHILMLPLAIPIILWFRLLFIVGQLVTYFRPDLLLKLYKNVENKSEKTASINL